jgi:hypothetical protein
MDPGDEARSQNSGRSLASLKVIVLDAFLTGTMVGCVSLFRVIMSSFASPSASHVVHLYL